MYNKIMYDLSTFWENSTEYSFRNFKLIIKHSRKPIFPYPRKALLIISIIFIIGVNIGWNLHSRQKQIKPLFNVKKKAKQVSNSAEEQENKIKILSANLLPIWEQSEEHPPETTVDSILEPVKEIEEKETASAILPMLESSPNNISAIMPIFSSEAKPAGMRILGEIQNISQSTIYEADIIVYFYQTEEEKLVGVKTGEWHPNYQFLPLYPGETNVYDVVVFNLPQFDHLTVQIKTNEKINETNMDLGNIKIQNKTLTKDTVSLTQNYTFSGTFINTGKEKILHPTIYVWLKNKEEKVFALTTKVLSAEPLLGDQSLSVNFPVATYDESQMSVYEVRVFGEKP